MRKLIATTLAALCIAPAYAQPSVGVTIGIHQPGVYGRINIGDVPQQALVLPQPVIIAAPRPRAPREPVYLYVPPVQQQNWRRYCANYGACGQPVYFVQDRWVRERYEEAHPGWERGHHRGWEKQKHKHKHKHKEGRGEGRDRGHHDRDD